MLSLAKKCYEDGYFSLVETTLNVSIKKFNIFLDLNIYELDEQ